MSSFNWLSFDNKSNNGLSSESNNDESNAIEEKKNITSNNDKPNFCNFFANYSVSVLFTICLGIIVFGSVGLYTTKVAAAGILPASLNDDGEQMTLKITDKVRKYVDMNITKVFGFYGLNIFSSPEKEMAQQAEFNPKKFVASYKDGPICGLLSQSTKSPFFLYMSSVVNYMASINNYAINRVYGGIGELLPESVILILYPLLSTFIYPATYLFNFVVSIFAHIKFLHQLFRQKDRNDNWEPVKDISYINIKNDLLFAFIWWWVCIISVFVMTPCMFLYSIISPLMATYTIVGKSSKKPSNFGTFIKDMFWFKKNLIMILAMISLLYNTITYLGNDYAIGALVAIVISIIGLNVLNNDNIISSPLYHNINAPITTKMLLDPNTIETYQLCSVPK